MTLAVPQDGFAQSDGTVDLIWGWSSSLYDLVADDFGVSRGGREVGKIGVDLGRSGGRGGIFIAADSSLDRKSVV